jgi:hypothetical protein
MRKCEEWSKENGYQEIPLRFGEERKEAHNKLSKYKWQS